MTKSKYKNGWTLITILILCFFALFLIYPIYKIFVKSILLPDGTLSLSAYKEFFGNRYYTNTIKNSLKVTSLATLSATFLGTLLAYIFRSVKIKGRTFLEVLVIISVLSPPFIGAYSWIMLLGRNGLFTRMLKFIGINFSGIYGFKGMLIVMSLQMFPLVYLYVSGALKSIDNSLNEAAENLGSSGFNRLFKVTLPLILPTLLSSALLVFMRSLADFGTPMLIGEGYRTLPVLIYNSFVSEMGGNEALGAAIGVVIVFLTTSIFIIQKYFADKKNIEMSALNPMEPQSATGIKNVVAHLTSYLLVFVTVLPVIVVFVTSFMKVEGKVFVNKFSLDSYRNVFSQMPLAITNTFKFSLIAMVIILVLGVLTAYASSRKRNIFTEILDVVSMLPYVISGSVMGIALVSAFNKKPIVLTGTAFIMFITFVIRRLPYTIRSSSAILSQINPNIEEAAQSLGATPFKTFIKITLPTMKDGIISGALMSWMTIISELSSTIILYVGSTTTLSIAIYSRVIRGDYGNAAALSSILMGTTVIALLIFFRLTGKKEIEL